MLYDVSYNSGINHGPNSALSPAEGKVRHLRFGTRPCCTTGRAFPGKALYRLSEAASYSPAMYVGAVTA